MGQLQLRAEVHGERLLQARELFFEQGDHPDGLVDPLILRSWERCRRFGVGDPHLTDVTSTMDRVALKTEQERNRFLLTQSRPIMEHVFEQIRESGSMVILADAHGLLLETVGDPDFVSRADRVSLMAGASWDENLRGTNAIGTALAEESPVTVLGAGWYAPVEAPGRANITIGIPTFNRPADAVNALAALTSDPLVDQVIGAVIVSDQGANKVKDHPDFAAAAAPLADRLAIHNQPNLGGSGGYSRVMYEALKHTDCEQILFMDDDIRVERVMPDHVVLRRKGDSLPIALPLTTLPGVTAPDGHQPPARPPEAAPRPSENGARSVEKSDKT